MAEKAPIIRPPGYWARSRSARRSTPSPPQEADAQIMHMAPAPGEEDIPLDVAAAIVAGVRTRTSSCCLRRRSAGGRSDAPAWGGGGNRSWRSGPGVANAPTDIAPTPEPTQEVDCEHILGPVLAEASRADAFAIVSVTTAAPRNPGPPGPRGLRRRWMCPEALARLVATQREVVCYIFQLECLTLLDSCVDEINNLALARLP